MTTNSINLKSNGVVGYNTATGVFTATAMTQFDVLVGGSTAQAIAQVAPSATTGMALTSAGASANPTFANAVVVAGGGTGLTSLVAYELLAGGTTTTGNIQQVGIGTSGQVLFSNGAGALPSFGAAPTGLAWVNVTSATQTIAVSTGYVTDNATQVTYTLPTTAAFGTVFEITGGPSGSATAPWTLAQNAGQIVTFGNSVTTTGTGGSLTSTLQYDSIRAVCVVANTQWNVLSSIGNLVVV